MGNRQPHGTRQGALLPDGDYIYPRNGNAMIEIGNRIETPEGVFYELEYGGEGNIYKNEDAFLNRPDEVCYVPEYAAEDREDWRVSESSDGCFTHNSLLALCKGNEEVCQDLFYSLEWTYPTTLLEEWDSNGYFDEIEGWYDSND
nr:thrombopoietin receptor [Bacteroides ovatus]